MYTSELHSVRILAASQTEHRGQVGVQHLLVLVGFDGLKHDLVNDFLVGLPGFGRFVPFLLLREDRTLGLLQTLLTLAFEVVVVQVLRQLVSQLYSR